MATNGKFFIDTIIDDRKAIIKVEALQEECTVYDLAEAIFIDGCTIRLKAFMSDNAKKVEIKLITVEGTTQTFEKKHPWHNVIALLYDITTQYKIK